MTAVAVRKYVKVRGKDEYRARTERELQAAAKAALAAVERKALVK